MVGKTTLGLSLGLITAAVVLIGAAQLPTLSEAQPGLWEITGGPGGRMPVRQCVTDVSVLSRFEHRANSCTSKVLKTAGSMTSIEYSCGAAGFGHSEIEVITPRSLRISTQGISGGLPFNYVLNARRIDDCPKSVAVTRH